MADLGAIGKAAPPSVIAYGGVISGIVHDAGGSPTRHLVRAYDELTGQLSGGAFSSATDGTYSINLALQYAGRKHYVAEFDPTGTQNARIFDLITIP